MVGARTRGLGLLLILLSLIGEVFALLAHRASSGFSPGPFTRLAWILLFTFPIPAILGAALLVRFRAGS